MLSPISDETPIDPSHLLVTSWDGSRASLNLLEAENILKPTAKYLVLPLTAADAPFTFDWMIQVHREMFCDVWAWAGTFRKSNLNIGIDWQYVETRLWELAADISYWQTTAETLLADAAEIHHRAVQIHPFPNGNGRWSRLLANIWLRRHDLPPTLWPDAELGAAGAVRAEYIAAVKAADARDRRPLIELHRRYTFRPDE